MSESLSSAAVDPARAGRGSVPDAADRMLRSLADRRTFGVAQGLLVGLTGCTLRQAGTTLMSAADHRAVSVADLAALLIASVEALAGGSADDHAEALVAGLEDSARRTRHVDESSARLRGSVDTEWLGWPGTIMVATPILAGDLRGVTVEGELDLSTVPEFQAAVAEVHDGAVGVFLLNLSELTFLDATGVRAFEDLYAATTGNGVTLRVAGPIAPAPRRLLGIAVDRRWLPPVFDSG